MSRWFKIPNALRRADDVSTSTTIAQHEQQHQRGSSSDLSQISTNESQGQNHQSQSVAGGRSSDSDESAAIHNGTGKRSLFKRGSRTLHFDKEGGGGHGHSGSLSIAKRVKSSLHLNTTGECMSISDVLALWCMS